MNEWLPAKRWSSQKNLGTVLGLGSEKTMDQKPWLTAAEAGSEYAINLQAFSETLGGISGGLSGRLRQTVTRPNP